MTCPCPHSLVQWLCLEGLWPVTSVYRFSSWVSAASLVFSYASLSIPRRQALFRV